MVCQAASLRRAITSMSPVWGACDHSPQAMCTHTLGRALVEPPVPSRQSVHTLGKVPRPPCLPGPGQVGHRAWGLTGGPNCRKLATTSGL